MKSLTLLSILCALFLTSQSYSPTLALQLGYMSSVAYENAASIQAWNCSTCKYNISDPKVFSNSSIQGFTGYSSALSAIIVSFRGSSNFQNWLINLSTTRSSYDKCTGCSVHTGFNSGYSSLSNLVRSAVQNLKAKYRGAKLFVTGHSLGGALAILGAADLKSIHGNVDQVYTFGQPRVGNAAFAEWYQRQIPNTFRLIHYADIVPHVPPSNFGFQHNGHQEWYQRGMTSFKTCDAEAPECANSVSVTSYSTDDHSLNNYLKLKAISEERGMLQKLWDYFMKLVEKSHIEQQESSWADEEQQKVEAVINKIKTQQEVEQHDENWAREQLKKVNQLLKILKREARVEAEQKEKVLTQ